ncbi:hypothetical protein [Paenibacillus sp. YYML68]|uniref:hypothetical protein n=1 Tax=Paenibacillus sp. YYML68 TaxID=2909250 RepID=UPI00248FF628|nr:hypothetical protein [Paenibacillus sp. YYML68]
MTQTKLNFRLTDEEDRYLSKVLDRLIAKGAQVDVVNQAREHILEHFQEARVQDQNSLEGLGTADHFVEDYLKRSNHNSSRTFRYVSILVFALIVYGGYYLFLR